MRRRGGNARLFGQDTRGQLVGAHFEAEKGRRRTDALGRIDAHRDRSATVRRVEGDVGHQRGLAHARTAGKNDKVGIVQAADLG
jgi:hypothetical protein